MRSEEECWSKHYSSQPAWEHEKAIRAPLLQLYHGNMSFFLTITDSLLFHSSFHHSEASLKAHNCFQGCSFIPSLICPDGSWRCTKLSVQRVPTSLCLYLNIYYSPPLSLPSFLMHCAYKWNCYLSNASFRSSEELIACHYWSRPL